MKELKNLKTLNNKSALAVVPVNKFDDKLLNECLYSLANQTTPIDVCILVSDSIKDEAIKRIEEIASEPVLTKVVKGEDDKPIVEETKSEAKLNFVIETTSSDNFSSAFNDAFNLAVENGYTWITVVEKDDFVEPNWISTFDRHSSEMENISIFFPVVRQIVAGNMTGHLNEATWLEGKAEIAGQADLQILMAWNCLNPTGCMMKVENIKEYSEEREDGKFYPFKDQLNVASSYEFFLRMIYEDLKTYTIPRFGYQMRMDTNKGSFDKFSSKIPSNITTLSEKQGGMTQHQIGFWMEQAKSEYFMTEDREIEYEAPEMAPVA